MKTLTTNSIRQYLGQSIEDSPKVSASLVRHNKDFSKNSVKIALTKKFVNFVFTLKV